MASAPSPSAPSVPSAAAPRALSLVPVAVAVVVVGALYLAKDVLVPIVLAVLLAFVLAPLVGLLRRLRLGRTFAVVIAMLLALAAVGFTATVMGQQVAGLAPDLPRTAERIQKKVAALGKSGMGRLPDQLSRAASRFQTTSPTPPAQRLARRARPIPVEVHEPPETSWQTAQRLLAPIIGPLETLLIVVVVAVFILLQREDLRDRIIRLFGSSDLHRTTQAIDEAAGRLSRYFLTQVALNSAFGAVIAFGLYWIGVPSPLLWGVLAGLMRVYSDTVNMVNAPFMAKERGLDVREVRHDREGDYHTLVRVSVATSEGERSVAGTLFGDQNPRLVELFGIKVEADLAGHMLYVVNEDAPGFIGRIGTALGDAGVNIGTFHLGRRDAGGEAVLLLSVDSPVGEDLLQTLCRLPGVKKVKALRFG